MRSDDLGSSRASTGDLRLVRCPRCGLVRQDPMPSVEALRDAYLHMRDESYAAETAGRLRASRRSLRLLSRYLGGRTGRLLDVGCSTGIFLGVAEDAGWSVFGIEPSEWAIGKARTRFGERVVQGAFENVKLENDSFDAVTLWDVLEHVPEPPAVIEKAARVLRPDGLLAINVPNIESWIARVMGRRWPLLLVEHLYYFTKRSLLLLLEPRGFVVLGFHLHPVHFSIGYLRHRLRQHDMCGGGSIARVPSGRARARTIPLLLGECTVVARRSRDHRQV